MAKEIANFLDEERLSKAVIVGDFSGSPRLRSSGGIEIRRAITEQLEAAGITVSETADLQLMGNFKRKEAKAFPTDEFDSVALEIDVIILDGNDDELVELPITVFGSVALQLTGAQFDLDPRLDDAERQKELQKQYTKPPTKINKTETRPSEDSPFAMEILVVNGNRLTPRPAEFDAARRPFVELHRGEEYVVRVHNRAEFEIAVLLTVDGVNMFVDAKDTSSNSQVVIQPGGQATIPGWYVTKTNTKAFEIGGYEESVAKRVGSSTGVGTISAAFRACWDPSSDPPADEPGGAAKGNKATKQGRDISRNYQQVTKDLGKLRSLITVRYDR
jgi:hypothetical protein